MGKYTGDLLEVAIGRETTRGTAVAPTFGLKWTDMSVVDKTIMAIDESRSGIIEDSRNSFPVGLTAEGELSGPVRDKSIGLLLYSLMGTLASAVVETTAYEHTITIQEGNQHQSLTLHKKDPQAGSDHALAIMDKMEFVVETDKMVMFTSGFKSKARATQTRTVTYATENTFLPQHASFKLASAQSGLDAASAINVRSAKLTLENNSEDDRSLGSTAPTDIINKQFAGTLEVEIVLSADTYITALLAGTAYAARLDITNTDVTIGASTNPRVRFDAYRVILQEASPAYSAGDLTIQTLSFKLHYSETDSVFLKAYVRNLTASY